MPFCPCVQLQDAALTAMRAAPHITTGLLQASPVDYSQALCVQGFDLGCCGRFPMCLQFHDVDGTSTRTVGHLVSLASNADVADRCSSASTRSICAGSGELVYTRNLYAWTQRCAEVLDTADQCTFSVRHVLYK